MAYSIEETNSEDLASDEEINDCWMDIAKAVWSNIHMGFEPTWESIKELVPSADHETYIDVIHVTHDEYRMGVPMCAKILGASEITTQDSWLCV